MDKNLLILCGGRSAEHEISLRSAAYVASLVPPEYKLFVVGIDREGLWHHLPPTSLSKLTSCEASSGPLVTFNPGLPRPSLRTVSGEAFSIDVVFPMLHGPGGEDGAIQGWLQCLGVPYVGSGIAASALAMDKHLAKLIFQAYGLPLAPWTVIYGDKNLPSYQHLIDRVGEGPFFVKPASLGSSIGVSRIYGPEDYETKVRHALRYSLKVIIEKALTGREVECAVLGHLHLQASGVGEIVLQEGEFYSYEAKYLSQDKAKVFPSADLSPDCLEKIQHLSLKAFQALGCSGMARVDSFITADGIFLNEVNTIPGFTPISLYPQLWAQAWVAPSDLIQKLIQCAYERFNQESRLLHLPEELLQNSEV